MPKSLGLCKGMRRGGLTEGLIQALCAFILCHAGSCSRLKAGRGSPIEVIRLGVAGAISTVAVAWQRGQIERRQAARFGPASGSWLGERERP